MDVPVEGFPVNALTRRQFGVLMGGGAVLLAGGAMYGVIAGSESAGPGSGFVTPFGRVVVRRAGRFARLDAQGRRAASNLAMAAARLNTAPHFGAAGAGRSRRAGGHSPSGVSALGGHGHGGGTGDPRRRQPVNSTWGDVVVLDVEVRNAGTEPVLFSPGQLRLRLGGPEVTVIPQDSDRAPGPVAASATEHILISYLAPSEEEDFELEFTDELSGQLHRLPLPLPATTGVLS